jgi:hypothetical protein
LRRIEKKDGDRSEDCSSMLGDRTLSIIVFMSAWLSAAAIQARGSGVTDNRKAACPLRKVLRVVLIGDSTVASYPLARPVRGWGQVLHEFFSAKVEIINLAKSAS